MQSSREWGEQVPRPSMTSFDMITRTKKARTRMMRMRKKKFFPNGITINIYAGI